MNPRIQVSLSPETYARVQRFARSQNISLSKAVSQIIEHQGEQLDALSQFHEKIGDVSVFSPEAIERVQGQIQDGEIYAQDLLARAMIDLEHVLSEILEIKEKTTPKDARTTARTEGATDILPPSINKGAKKASEGGQKTGKKSGSAK